MKPIHPLNKIWIISLVFLAVIPASSILAQVMQSTNYKMQFDSVNVGGLESDSTNYNLSDTLGEVGTGYSNSTNYNLHAGFQQIQEGTYISMSSPSDISLASISGLAGGSSEGTATWIVSTDNTAGYTLTVQSSTTPALTSGSDSFADYTPSGGIPDYDFSINSTDSEFGFTPESIDVVSTYKDDGSTCNTGSNDTQGKCWSPFSTTPITIVQRTTSNHPTGTSNTIRVKAESGTSHIQPPGTYSAQLTVTATML